MGIRTLSGLFGRTGGSFDHTAMKPLLIEGRKSVPAEASRTLRTNLEFVNIDSAARSVVGLSMAHEGKSSTATNLVLTIAAAEKMSLIEGHFGGMTALLVMYVTSSTIQLERQSKTLTSV